uniref:CXXC-type domain-containing protein n=1 Tax=Dracunculus medinensis TaxID=318479 RepID=A0A0N4U9W8_DRAME
LLSMPMGPMILMDNQMNGPIYHNQHHIHPGPPPPNGLPLLAAGHTSLNQTTTSNGQPTLMTSSMNRSQRCGVCRGCQCKPCGQCTYCQDSPQFGGPGVKKQSCIERRCLRVLENRLQRDAPSFKARVGCNNCEDCRLPDCLGCLVCLDKRFFDNRYMTGAMCAKKRCNNATSIELPATQNAELRQVMIISLGI